MKQSVFYLLIVLATISLTSSSCSKKPVEVEEVEPVTKKVYSGSVRVSCETAPIAYNLDSLINNCSDNKFLSEISSLKDITSCVHYFNDIEHLVGHKNWDFKASITPDDCNLKWNELSSIEQPIQVNTITEFEGNENISIGFFTNGCDIQISEKQNLTLLFFDLPIQGCSLYSMVWEYVETE